MTAKTPEELRTGSYGEAHEYARRLWQQGALSYRDYLGFSKCIDALQKEHLAALSTADSAGWPLVPKEAADLLAKAIGDTNDRAAEIITSLRAQIVDARAQAIEECAMEIEGHPHGMEFAAMIRALSASKGGRSE